jgi:hypothetical protein
MTYWCARIALVAAWLVLARWLWAERGAPGWRAGAIIAALFASMRAWPWNYELLEAARALLRAADVYEERLWFKIALAIVLAAIAVPLVRGIAAVRANVGALDARIGVGLQAALLAIETCSLDDAMPRWMMDQPGRYLLEGTFAGLALVGAWRLRAAPDRGGAP